MVNNDHQPKNLKTFLVMWVGQLISIIGSGLTSFGLIGVGTGRGFALAFLISGVFLIGLSLFVLIYPRIRNLESEIPDAIPDDQKADQAAILD